MEIVKFFGKPTGKNERFAHDMKASEWCEKIEVTRIFENAKDY